MVQTVQAGAAAAVTAKAVAGSAAARAAAARGEVATGAAAKAVGSVDVGEMVGVAGAPTQVGRVGGRAVAARVAVLEAAGCSTPGRRS